MHYAAERAPREELVEAKGVRVVIEPGALLTIAGTTMDWREDEISAQIDAEFGGGDDAEAGGDKPEEVTLDESEATDAGEEEADRRVLPLAVIDVACDQHEGDALGDGGGDQIGKGGAASLREAPGDGLVLQGEAQQRAAQMQIGAMQKGEIHGLAQVNKTGTSSGSRPRARGNRHGSRFPTRRRIALSVLCL